MNSIRTVIKNFYGMKLKKYSNGILFLSADLNKYNTITQKTSLYKTAPNIRCNVSQ